MLRARKISCSLLRAIGALTLLAFFLGFGWGDLNPVKHIKTLTKYAKKGLSEVGSVTGSFFGGLIDSAMSPTVSNLEHSGQNLISSANKAFEDRLNQLDKQATARLGQLDHILEKRIGQLSETARERIIQMDTVFAMRLDQLDRILADRIEQIDSAAEQRIGNLDTVATKAMLSLEESLIRVIGVGCLTAFLFFGILWTHRKYIRFKNLNPGANFPTFLRTPAVRQRLALQIAGLVLFPVVLWIALSVLPGRPAARVRDLAERHRNAMNIFLSSFHFRDAYYHASQLRALDSTKLSYAGLRLKLDLVRDLFSRPTLLQREDGVSELLERVRAVETYLGSDDPDVVTIKGFILWQSSGSKIIEDYSARCFARALQIHPNQPFPLKALAISYLDLYLDAPASDRLFANQARLDPDAKELRDAAAHLVGKRADGIGRSGMRQIFLNAYRSLGYTLTNATPPLPDGIEASVPREIRPYVHYNLMAKQLRRSSGTNYLAMLQAFAATNVQHRILSATNLTIAWNDFVNDITNSFLDTPQIRLAPLLLNDVPAIRAHLYADNKLSPDDPPKAQDDKVKGMAPRARLEKAVADFFSTNVSMAKIVFHQESLRYELYEKDVLEFEHHYVAYRRSTVAGGKEQEALAAALSAARLGLTTYDSNGTPITVADDIIKDCNLKDEELASRWKGSFDPVLKALQVRHPGYL